MHNYSYSQLLFETSWEVCNKVGGIYTVLSTKANVLNDLYGDRLVFFGPDVWTPEHPSPYFIERKTLLSNFSKKALPYGITVRVGRWDVPSQPLAVLVRFDNIYPLLNDYYAKAWERYGVDSLNAYGDYPEGCAFSIAVAIVMRELATHLGVQPHDLTAHFNEWTTGMGLLDMQMEWPQAATLFTTHATSIGRSICSNSKPLYDYFTGYHGDQMARELNMVCKHSLEKAAAHAADCFTAVSEVTARECEQMLEIRPQVVTPNGFEQKFVPAPRLQPGKRKNARAALLKVATAMTGKDFDDSTFIVATSGRNEFRNKGLDLYIDAMRRLRDKANPMDRDVVAFILVPGWVKEPSAQLLENLQNSAKGNVHPDWLTHRLNNEMEDATASALRSLGENGPDNKVSLIWLPCYLDGSDGVLGLKYYDALPGADLTIFPSYYEPWGYTPLESIAFGVPTITTDKSGFGQWILANFHNSFESCGVKVEERGDSDFQSASERIAGDVLSLMQAPAKAAMLVRDKAKATSLQADWKTFIKYYQEAFVVASQRRDLRLQK